MSTAELPLASEFAQPTEADWRELVEATLKGADFDRKLVTTTYDGLRIAPLYTPADGGAAEADGYPGYDMITNKGVKIGGIQVVGEGEAMLELKAPMIKGDASGMMVLNGGIIKLN